jgi:hypothetical protein
MKLRELLPLAAELRELVNWGDDHLYFESDVLILPNTTFYGWRMFIEEQDGCGIVAEQSFCKNTDEWGWQDEAESRVPEPILEILEMELLRFKKSLSVRLGVDVDQWEASSLDKLIAK